MAIQNLSQALSFNRKSIIYGSGQLSLLVGGTANLLITLDWTDRHRFFLGQHSPVWAILSDTIPPLSQGYIA